MGQDNCSLEVAVTWMPVVHWKLWNKGAQQIRGHRTSRNRSDIDWTVSSTEEKNSCRWLRLCLNSQNDAPCRARKTVKPWENFIDQAKDNQKDWQLFKDRCITYQHIAGLTSSIFRKNSKRIAWQGNKMSGQHASPRFRCE
jgi:hypothetical protein